MSCRLGSFMVKSDSSSILMRIDASPCIYRLRLLVHNLLAREKVLTFKKVGKLMMLDCCII